MQAFFRKFHTKLLDFKFVQTQNQQVNKLETLYPVQLDNLSPGCKICTAPKPFISLCCNWANSPKASNAFAVEYAALSSLRWTQIWPHVSQICCKHHCQHNYLCPRVWSTQLWFIWKTWPTLTEYVINNLQRFVLSDVKLVETHMVDLSRH